MKSAWWLGLVSASLLLASCEQSPLQSDAGDWTDSGIGTSSAALLPFGGVLPVGFTQAQCPQGFNVIVGTAGNDLNLNGTAGNDCIFGLGGNDIIRGLGGDDILIGGPGDDGILGGDGDDLAVGDIGNDVIEGGNGTNALYGDAGEDTLRGGPGVDRLGGGIGNDVLHGLGGDDTLDGGAGDDTLEGWEGNDTITGGIGRDRLAGGPGHDVLDGEAGNDTLQGGDGNDTLRGGIGDDNIYGEGGNDRIAGDAGDDRVWGGDGNDTINGGIGTDYLFGDAGSDALEGGDGNDFLYGGLHNDVLNGGAGADRLEGEAEDDVLVDSNTGNTFIGGDGFDACPTGCEIGSLPTACGAGGACASPSTCMAGVCLECLSFLDCSDGISTTSDSCDPWSGWRCRHVCTGSGVETCDRSDNDCDGRNDEGVPTVTCYDDLDDDEHPAADVAGYVCNCELYGYATATVPVAGSTLDCNDQDATIGPGTPEVCDGQDNNCNGVVDDGVGSSTASCGIGACARTVNVSCVNGSMTTCTPGTPAPNDASCNGVDNDCNGAIDEDFAPQSITCPEDAAAGQTACIAGRVVDDCKASSVSCPVPDPREQFDELCDGCDDDDDRAIDEDCDVCGDNLDNDGSGVIDCYCRSDCSPTVGRCSGGLTCPGSRDGTRCGGLYVNYGVGLGTYTLTTEHREDTIEQLAQCQNKPVVESSDVVLLWTPPPMGRYEPAIYVIDTAGSEIDTVVDVYRGCNPPDVGSAERAPFACNDDALGSTAARVVVDLRADGFTPINQNSSDAPRSYVLVIQSARGEKGNITLNIRRQPQLEYCPPAEVLTSLGPNGENPYDYHPVDEDLDGLADCEDSDCREECLGLTESGLCTNGVNDDRVWDVPPRGTDCTDSECYDEPLCPGEQEFPQPYCDAPFRAFPPSSGLSPRTFALSTAYGVPVQSSAFCALGLDAMARIPIAFGTRTADDRSTYSFRLDPAPRDVMLSVAGGCADEDDACIAPSRLPHDARRSFVNEDLDWSIVDGAIEVPAVDGRVRLLLNAYGPVTRDGFFNLIVERRERGAACANDRDDDEDGLFDCGDPDCQLTACGEHQCLNGIDDDNNGDTDCDDSTCQQLRECRSNACADRALSSSLPNTLIGSTEEATALERVDACGRVALGPAQTYQWTPPAYGRYRIDTRGSIVDTVLTIGACGDEPDLCNDDVDGSIASEILYTVSETEALEPIAIGVRGFNGAEGDFVLNIARDTNPGEICDDRVDNGDSDSAIDCADSDCASDPHCAAPIETCGGGVDDDGDGEVDCADSDCAADPRCGETFDACIGDGDDRPNPVFDCSDPDCRVIDSDSDGTPDCEDRCPENPALTQPVLHYADRDNDGFGDAREPYTDGDRPVAICGMPGWVSVTGDCRDTDPEVSHTGSDRDCDRVDDDCDLSTDEGYVSVPSSCGLGVCRHTGMTSCVLGVVQGNCEELAPTGDDTDCDSIDDNCNGLIDEAYPTRETSCGLGACARTGLESCVTGVVVDTCVAPAPGPNDQHCDGIDEDCDGSTDEHFEAYDRPCGLGACATMAPVLCVNGAEAPTCDPGDGTAEVCDSIDNDCDGTIDNGVLFDCYADLDDDDYSGSSLVIERACSCGENMTARVPGPGTIDCNDGDANIHPGMDESCDEIDNDCNGATDEGVQTLCYADGDHDGFAVSVAGSTLACGCGVGTTPLRPEQPSVDVDCADNDADAYPGADETCDSVDNDCDGTVDEDAGCVEGEPYVGAPCVSDDDCISAELPTGFCYSERDNGIVGGVCLSFCTNGDSDCPDQSWCLRGEANGVQALFCVPGCDDEGECLRPEAQCTMVPDGDGRPVTYCLPYCTTNTDCSEGRACDRGICRPAEEIYCEPQGEHGDTQCDGYNTDCDDEVDEGYESQSACASGDCSGIADITCDNGVIETTCDESSPECVSTPVIHQCVRDEDCTGLGNWHCMSEGMGVAGGRCVQYCSDGSVCGEGTTCMDGACMITCRSDQDCSVPGEHCLVTESSKIGTCIPFCEDDSQCVNGCNLRTHLCDCRRETCDDEDNDCDGLVDEGSVCECNSRAEMCNGADDNCNGLVDEGNICCMLTLETCDGVDNNCNGAIDEDLNDSPGLCRPLACPTGGRVTCGAGGDATCAAGPGCEASCVDALDNDGDNSVDCADTDCALEPECGHVGAGSQCLSDADCAPLGPSGRCQREATSGLPGGYCTSACTSNDDCAIGELCNGTLCVAACLSDHTCVHPGQECIGWGGLGCLPLCDQDSECRSLNCNEAQGRCICGEETCNGIDDDCNGAIDDSDLCACQQTSEECNGADDDCDGRVDEEIIATTVPCGCGVMARSTCTAGMPGNNCPIDPCGEDCHNGVDDDGNGQLDCADYRCTHDPLCVAGSEVGTACRDQTECPVYWLHIPEYDIHLDFQFCSNDDVPNAGYEPVGACVGFCAPGYLDCPSGSVCADGACLRACDWNGECGAPGLQCEQRALQNGTIEACVPGCEDDSDCGDGLTCYPSVVGTMELRAGVCRVCADSDATCDGHDDDCDDLVDEDYGNGTGSLDYTCGIGRCQGIGRRECLAGYEYDRGCGEQTAWPYEIRNGIDDDCNGVTDEPGTTCQHDSDCTPRALCVDDPLASSSDGVCVWSTCENGAQDAGELGVDCGGYCPACTGGECGAQCQSDGYTQRAVLDTLSFDDMTPILEYTFNRTYVGRGGRLETVPEYYLRFEDVDGARVALFEGWSYNHFAWSARMGSPSGPTIDTWTNTTGFDVPIGTLDYTQLRTALDGQTFLPLIRMPAGGLSSHYQYPAYPFARTISVWVAAPEGATATTRFSDYNWFPGEPYPYAYVQADVTDRWQRIDAALPPGPLGFGGIMFNHTQLPTNTDGTPGDPALGAADFYAFGFQAEQHTFPTSYMPTQGDVRQRPADEWVYRQENVPSWIGTSAWQLDVYPQHASSDLSPGAEHVLLSFAGDTRLVMRRVDADTTAITYFDEWGLPALEVPVTWQRDRKLTITVLDSCRMTVESGGTLLESDTGYCVYRQVASDMRFGGRLGGNDEAFARMSEIRHLQDERFECSVTDNECSAECPCPLLSPCEADAECASGFCDPTAGVCSNCRGAGPCQTCDSVTQSLISKDVHDACTLVIEGQPVAGRCELGGQGLACDLCEGKTCPGCNSCDSATGQCTVPDDTKTCDDGNACTTDSCSGGACVGSVTVTCGDCRVCDPENGQCTTEGSEDQACGNDSGLCRDGACSPYAKVYTEVFSQKCAGCHNPTRFGGLLLSETADASLDLDATNPNCGGNKDACTLVRVRRGEMPAHSPTCTPYSGSGTYPPENGETDGEREHCLNEDQYRTLEAWVNAGAPH